MRKRCAVALWCAASAVGAGPAWAQGLVHGETVVDGAGAEGLEAVTNVAVTVDGPFVYTVSFGDEAISHFVRSPATGDVAYVDTLAALRPHRHLAFSPDEAFLYTTASVASVLSVYQRSPATGSLALVEFYRGGPGGTIPELGNVAGIEMAPDGSAVFVLGGSPTTLSRFSRDPSDGTLTLEQSLPNGVGGVQGIGFANRLAVSPDGLNIYVASQLDNALAVFQIDPLDGSLSFLEALVEGVDGIDGLESVDDVVVSADGLRVYTVAGGGSVGSDWIAVFSRNPADGSLQQVQRLPAADFVICDQGISGDRSSLVIHPDGGWIYASQPLGSAVISLRVDPVTGMASLFSGLCDLSMGGTVPGLLGIEELAIDPTGTVVYAVSDELDTLVTFRVALLFADGFESGDTAGWSAAAP